MNTNSSQHKIIIAALALSIHLDYSNRPTDCNDSWVKLIAL